MSPNPNLSPEREPGQLQLCSGVLYTKNKTKEKEENGEEAAEVLAAEQMLLSPISITGKLRLISSIGQVMPKARERVESGF